MTNNNSEWNPIQTKCENGIWYMRRLNAGDGGEWKNWTAMNEKPTKPFDPYNRPKPDHLTQEQWDRLMEIDRENDKAIAREYNKDNMMKFNPLTGQMVGSIMDDSGHLSTIRTDSIYGYSNKECRELELRKINENQKKKGV